MTVPVFEWGGHNSRVSLKFWQSGHKVEISQKVALKELGSAGSIFEKKIYFFSKRAQLTMTLTFLFLKVMSLDFQKSFVCF